MILDAITSSPINVFVSIVIGIGLVYLYCRKPASSSSSGSSPGSASVFTSQSSRTSHSNYLAGSAWADVPSGLVNDRVIDSELQNAIAQIERQERDMIRKEQDEAYQRSLQADREKQLTRERELREKQEKEREEKDRVSRLEEFHNKLIALKDEIASNIPPEPASNEPQDSLVKLLFKLPDGTRIKRNFRKEDKVKYIYWYTFSLKNAPLQFKLTTNFPKRDLPGRPPLPEDFEPDAENKSPNCEETLAEQSLTETQIIFVHDLEA